MRRVREPLRRERLAVSEEAGEQGGLPVFEADVVAPEGPAHVGGVPVVAEGEDAPYHWVV